MLPVVRRHQVLEARERVAREGRKKPDHERVSRVVQPERVLHQQLEERVAGHVERGPRDQDLVVHRPEAGELAERLVVDDGAAADREDTLHRVAPRQEAAEEARVELVVSQDRFEQADLLPGADQQNLLGADDVGQVRLVVNVIGARVDEDPVADLVGHVHVLLHDLRHSQLEHLVLEQSRHQLARVCFEGVGHQRVAHDDFSCGEDQGLDHPGLDQVLVDYEVLVVFAHVPCFELLVDVEGQLGLLFVGELGEGHGGLDVQGE